MRATAVLIPIVAVAVGCSSSGAPVSPLFEPEEGHRALIERDRLVPPREILRREVAVACKVTYDITEAGETENICGACATTIPDDVWGADVLKEQMERSAELMVGRLRYAPGPFYAGENTEITLSFEDDQSDLPSIPEQPVCPKEEE